MDEEKKTLPITTGLRDAVHRYNKYSSMTMPCESQTYVKCDADTFDRMCDAIDAVHANLEAENVELRSGRRIGEATVTVRPTLDWTGVRDDLRWLAEHIGR